MILTEAPLLMKKAISGKGIEPFLQNGNDFINDSLIWELIEKNKNPGKKRVRAIIAKSLEIKRLEPEETAALINVTDRDLLDEMNRAALAVKKKVYDNRIVTFAPLYLSNLCVNNCLYCAFRKNNPDEKRRQLTLKETEEEAKALVATGHKRVIVVYGEHPSSGIDYMTDTINTIYSVKIRHGQIRRVNVNAAPMTVKDLKKLKKAGIGTYQVFQETYHHETYAKMHPSGPKSDYRWRLYALHRAQKAGIDDVAIGALFGLYDWRFEVMGLLYHTIDLEKHFNNIGPHTISFPRLEPASGSNLSETSNYRVRDEDFLKLISIIRLSVPYTGMIITARETARIRRKSLELGVTQTDASTKIGIGAYSDRYSKQEAEKQQFMLGDTRSLDEVIGEFAGMGYIVSFCTAGYRCGRTGECIMNLLKKGEEKWFCKMNAVLTFREWLDDYASASTKKKGEIIIDKEINEIKTQKPELFKKFMAQYVKTVNGHRDIYF
ncbi:MAG: [FeFe] hydrogenase H-cluster radical SAM maturase HydG [Elusimicrobia bacterium CG03_land_8_20_14_0_80_50_18]|nr:MAG: [FeFe] hydrogenase H-cluster radical SAM maturase HydG [Elusimicrobia bacterium CG03_land_8_20_14_0_80_50_18]